MTADALEDAPAPAPAPHDDSAHRPPPPSVEDPSEPLDGEQPPVPAANAEPRIDLQAEGMAVGTAPQGMQGPTTMADAEFLPLPRGISPMPAFEPERGDGDDSAIDDSPADGPGDGLDDHDAARQEHNTPLSPSAPSSTSTVMTPTTGRSSRRSVSAGTSAPQPPRPREELPDMPRQRRQDGERGTTLHAPRPRRRPSALDYLVSESPTGIPRAALETRYRRFEMGAQRHASLGPKGGPAPSVFHGRHAAAPPDGPSRLADAPLGGPDVPHSPPGAVPVLSPQAAPQAAHHHLPAQTLSPEFGSPPPVPPGALPGMPMAHAQPPSVFQTGFGEEKPPMTGYELLAAKLVGGLGGPTVVPMYRRFEALNHRLLLYMQADLADLEAELRALDGKDTIDRGCGMIPASRRHERWSSTSLSQQRTEILGQIGYKLGQYNKIMASFRKVGEHPRPSPDEIHTYKSWLCHSRLVVEDEAKFLDYPDDLVCLVGGEPANHESGSHGVEFLPPDTEDITPMPYRADDAELLPPAKHDAMTPRRSPSPVLARDLAANEALRETLTPLALGMFVCLFVPIATFSVIPTFAGRVVVVGLVVAGVATALTQLDLMRLLDRRTVDWAILAAAYGVSMVIAASMLVY